MNCDYFDRGECRSCTHILTPYDVQLADRQRHVETLLENVPNAANLGWLAPAASSTEGFRSKAKLAVGGTTDNPTLGLLDSQWKGVDLSECPIVHPGIRHAVPALRSFIIDNGLQPYDVATRKGELKYILITADTQGHSAPEEVGLLIRFVLRSRAHEALLRSRLPRLREALPQARVVTINLHPQHAAIVEGPEEIVLTDDQTLPLSVGDVTLRVGPRSFTQTNTAVASELYRTVAQWVARQHTPTQPGTPTQSLWDLYCGVGGFALHAARGGVAHVTGVEISDAAIESAQEAARDLFGDEAQQRTTFLAGDATEWAIANSDVADTIIVNPPRRGIGARLATWLNDSGAATIVYSSCHPKTLVRDLQIMDNYQVLEGRLFDMFPHTDHAEVAVLCVRRDSAQAPSVGQ